MNGRLRPGHVVHILNISSDGALVETPRRLLPGSAIDLHLDLPAETVNVRARVLRSTVTAVHAGSVQYRGALLFDRPLEPSPVVPNRESRSRS
jgi:hypothetical protein